MDIITVSGRHRTSTVGTLGEELVKEALINNGFKNVINLNESCHNQPFADLLAEKNAEKFFIGVKTRNENRACGGLNSAYNCILVSDRKNKMLKKQGKSVLEITEMALQQVNRLASEFGAIPAWATVAIRPEIGMYAVYFGMLAELGCRRSIPMTPKSRKKYKCLVDWNFDVRITPNLTNR